MDGSAAVWRWGKGLAELELRLLALEKRAGR